MTITITPKKSIQGEFTVPGDKSISHRSVMLGSIASGTTEIDGFLTGDDCLSTIACFQSLGVNIQVEGTHVTVFGRGLHGLTAPQKVLDVGNSGTTLRLMSGLLAGQPFDSRLTGDQSIQKRPMDRVATPLTQMGAHIEATMTNGKRCAPLHIYGQSLHSISYTLPVASAQVKSAILLAGLYAQGDTVVTEPQPTRDHTEIMLNYLGADIRRENDRVICHPVPELYAKPIIVPGDISSAAYFLVAGCILKDSVVTIKNVGVNPTRTGIIDILQQMNAQVKLINQRVSCGEMVGDLVVQSSSLKATTIGGAFIPRLIDEIPVLAVAACFAEGTTVIKDAEELKVKESNRIQTVVTELSKMGAHIEETADGMLIHGGFPLKGAVIDSHMDHRIAMSLAIAALACQGETVINDSQCVDISFPSFYDYINQL